MVLVWWSALNNVNQNLEIQEMEVKTEMFPSLPQVIQYTQALVDNSSCSVQYSDIGIITPYRKQVREMHIICMRA